MKDTDFAVFAKLLKDKSGFALTPAKTYLLESRVLPVASRHGCADLTALADLLRKSVNNALIYEIVEAMTTNETLFFRDDKPFRHFRSALLPLMMKNREHKKSLRIWSAACSTGQEPYSIAITMSDLIQEHPGWNVEIIGTDISGSVIEKAKQGIYTQFEIQRGLPVPMMVKYFTRRDAEWQIHEKFRRMVRFEPFNLMQGMEKFGTFDIIFCRNVLIYFDEDTKRSVLQNLSRRLSPDGYLLLGSTESAICANDCLTMSESCAGLYTILQRDKTLLSGVPGQIPQPVPVRAS
ncbi:MAG: cheR methyltransferase, binding domain protein [Micavibrio sp.]|nr:cheR methyltransferase, binding domain protein [Micavibrio sp.]